MRSIALIIGIAILGCYASAQCNYHIIVPVYDGECDTRNWSLIFEDNFDGNELDLQKWTLPYQGMLRSFDFSSEKQWYANTGSTPSLAIENNIVVSNGTLKLIARKENPEIVGTYVTNYSTNPWTTASSNFKYSSGHIETKKQFGYGAYEIRCKIPKGHGFFPAFWLFAGGPGYNEIDIFEFWNERTTGGNFDPNLLAKIPHFNMIHDHDNNSSTSNATCSDKYNGVDYSTTFHTFTLIWDNYKIEWYIDGQLVRRKTKFYTMLGQELDCYSFEAWTQMAMIDAYPMEEYMTAIINFAMKEPGIEEPNSSTPFPSQMEVDYFRYWRKNTCTGTYVANATGDLGLSSENYNTIVRNNIVIGGSTTIPSGQQLDLKGGSSITLGPGTTIQNGSFVRGWIESPICFSSSGIQVVDEQYGSEINAAMNQFAEPLPTLTVNGQKEVNWGISIFPNPFSDIVTVVTPQYESKIIVSDINGTIIVEENFDAGVREENIDLSEVASGVYFFTISSASSDKSKVFRLVKQ